MQLYAITPNDLLFFRDGRPMETGEGSGGHGARWPFPTIFFDALHAALHRAFPENGGTATQPWEVRHRARGRNGRTGELRFGGLHTVGPYPRNQNGEWLFPAPLDARPGSGGLVHASSPLVADRRLSNLPPPLSASVANRQAPTKEPVPAWWTAAAIERYLADDQVNADGLSKASDLWSTEWTTGIGTNPAMDAQDQVRIYSASYLRLKPSTSLGCAGTLPGNEMSEVLAKLFPTDGHIVCGGQQRVCAVALEKGLLSEVLPRPVPVAGPRVKWLLLSPAIFPKSPDHIGGWLPSWVDAVDGCVWLPREKPPRIAGESRHQWRKRWNQPTRLDVRLVAACVGKPEVVTGWSDFLRATDGTHGSGKSTRLAVPAGSAYYFEGPDAPLLARLLTWDGNGPDTPQSRSGALGEKGLGHGITAPWNPW